jgi:hypothetical protein
LLINCFLGFVVFLTKWIVWFRCLFMLKLFSAFLFETKELVLT